MEIRRWQCEFEDDQEAEHKYVTRTSSIKFKCQIEIWDFIIFLRRTYAFFFENILYKFHDRKNMTLESLS